MPRRDPTTATRPGIHRILIVDDHPVVRAGLASLIDAEPDLEVCGQCSDAASALDAVGRVRPDLVLVDLSLGESSGLELLKALEQREFVTLVVSMHADLIWVERALRAGARGYVHKGGATRDVVTAIHHVRGGGMWVSESMSEQLLERRLSPGTHAPDEAPVTALSDRELEVFLGIGNALTTQQIAEQLHISPKTVQTYRQRIKMKLGLSTAAELTTQATRWVVEQAES